MVRPWLILADDLTGAADCATPFASRGTSSNVAWAPFHGGMPKGGVLALDLGTRGLPAAEAAKAHRDAVLAAGPGSLIFKKIDSTLRGQPAAEIGAVLGALRERGGPSFGILAPAFPPAARSTVGGRVLVRGLPLEESDLWKRDHTYPSSDLAALLAGAGVRAALLGIDRVRSGVEGVRAAVESAAHDGASMLVCDAETDRDLDVIARTALQPGVGAFCCGSAGLAQALAAAEPRGSESPRGFASGRGGSLFAVGSQAEVSRAAARRLSRCSGVLHIPVEPESLLEGAGLMGTLLKRVIDHLDKGGDVLAEIHMRATPNHWQGRILAEGLARLLRPASSHAGAVMATGGETARALLSGFGVHGIALATEVEPGFPVGVTLGDISIPVATKAGAFGDDESLVRCAKLLTRVRQEGRFS